MMQSLQAPANKEAATPPVATPSKEADGLTGQDRLLGNLLSGWVAQVLQLVSGFILPRLISDSLGQGSLGVWDFGWSVVSYFTLLQVDIVSSVNRYVARFRAAGDWAGLNAAVNSVGCVLKGIAVVIALLSCAVAWYVPKLMGGKLGGLVTEASWVVLFLGLTLAVQVQGAVYGGVLTGCHRWTIHNAIKTGSAIVSVGGGVAVVLTGFGIEWLAGVMLLAEALTRTAQWIAAHGVCPELKMSRRYFSRSVAKEMVRFGGKGYVNIVAQMLVNHTASVLVASVLGVATLALFNRPRNLIRALSSVINANAMVVVPMVGAMEAAGRASEIRQLAISASRYAAFFCLPLMILLTILGADFVSLWMGDAYADQVLITLLAISGLAEAVCFPLFRVLEGLNRHGRLAVINLAAAVVTVIGTSLVLLVFRADLRWVAAIIAIPSLIVSIVILPRCAAHALEIGFGALLWRIWSKPLLCCLPGAACCITVALIFPEPGLKRLVMAGSASMIGSGWFYWQHAVPRSLKSKLVSLIGRFTIGEHPA